MIWSESLSQSASKEILCSTISLEGECYNQSNAVYENGSCRETYEPFTDDDPQNGVAEALAELEYKNELLSLSILGSNVMLNVVMQNDKINKMPKTYKGIPMAGSDLEKRMDIATFDATKKYKEGTMVKFKSLDGEYILGEAGKSAPCAGGVSAFKAYDKSSYKGHNSPKDAIKSMGYGALDFVNTSLDSTSDLAFDACKYVMTRGILDESTNNKIVNYFDWIKEQKGKPSDLLHEHLKNESPHKETFDATQIGLEALTLLDSGIGAASYCGKLSRIKKLNAAEKVANSKKSENILNELNKEILGVNKGSAGAENVVTEADRIKQFNLNNCREQITNTLKKYRKELINNEDVQDISKICSTVDLGDLNLKGEAGSGIWKYNPTIKDYTGVDPRKFCKTAEDYTNYYRNLLSDTHLDDLPDSFWVGKNEGIIREDMAKLRADIERVKSEAADKGKFNVYGEPSFKSDWNVDNCAEIWSSRDAILKGARYDDLVYRTENLSGGFAEPCKNCRKTFKGTYNIDY